MLSKSHTGAQGWAIVYTIQPSDTGCKGAGECQVPSYIAKEVAEDNDAILAGLIPRDSPS